MSLRVVKEAVKTLLKVMEILKEVKPLSPTPTVSFRGPRKETVGGGGRSPTVSRRSPANGLLSMMTHQIVD